MVVLASLLLAVGIGALFGATIGSPLFAASYARLAHRARRPASAGLERIRLEALIPAHNEEKVIAQTLDSLVAAAENLRAAHGDVFEFAITVGLDHCTDETERRVREFAASSSWCIRTFVNPANPGKWTLLQGLVGRTKADWIALVDSGSVWDAGLLVEAWPHLRDGAVLGVAPSYVSRRGGLLEVLNWHLEQRLKRLENLAGGPVSVHGASVLYRLPPLQNALGELNDGTSWLNDDVVIPLTLRLGHPEGRIVYLTGGTDGGWVSDVGVRAELDVEYRRRRRMAVGNLQWIRALLLPNLARDPRVTLVALRRVLRLFWAYWVLLAGLGAGTLIALAARSGGEVLVLGGALAIAAVVAWRSNWIRRLAVAFLAGLEVPRYWGEFDQKRGVSWV
jgi:glycosyltransferase involved in cell wall biosynthesis